MLDPDGERELYLGVATAQTITRKRGERIIKVLKSADIPDAIRDDAITHIQEMMDDGLQLMDHLQQRVCTQLRAGDFNEMEEEALGTALECSQLWDAEEADTGDNSDDAVENANNEPPGVRSRKRSQPSPGELDNDGQSEQRGPKKSRKSANQKGGTTHAQAPANDGGAITLDGRRQPTDAAIVERRVDDHKAFLLEQRRSVEEIKRNFRTNSGKVILANIGLVDIAVARFMAAIDPSKPNLSIIPETMFALERFTQNLSKYEKIVADVMSGDAERLKEGIVSFTGDHSIGSISCQRDRKRPRKRRGEHGIPEILAPLAAAINRWNQNESCDLNAMIKVLDLGGPFENFQSNMNNVGMLVNCASTMTMHELFLGHEHLHKRSQQLWAAFHPGGRYDEEAKGTSIKQYMEQALIPALGKVELEALAVEVAKDMKIEWTNAHMEIRRPNLRHFRAASSDTPNGGKNETQEDYCGKEDDKTHRDRRTRMTCFLFTVLFWKSIQEKLPDGTFPHDFVRTLLLNSPTTVKRQCDFVTREGKAAARFRTFFDSGSHGPQSEIVKCVNENVKKKVDVGPEVYVIDSAAQIEDLERLLEL